MGVGVEEVVGGREGATTWSLRLSQGCKCGKYPPMCHSAISQHWGVLSYYMQKTTFYAVRNGVKIYVDVCENLWYS